jgi:hypothetical protein
VILWQELNVDLVIIDAQTSFFGRQRGQDRGQAEPKSES